MTRKYFGTDGIRGTVGEEPITAEFMLKLGWAVGKVFASKPNSKILIGKDTRISGYMFESALEAGLSAAGVNVRLLGPMPTPAIAYLTRTFKAQAGIVISASHNAYPDNGIKFFSQAGTKLADEVEREIEHQIEQPMTTVAPDLLGKAARISDATGRYIEFCKSTIPAATDLHGMKIVLDCANGATYQVAPGVFRELNANVISINVHPDGLNINEKCGSTSPEALRQRVIDEHADLGIAFDGDGDRVIMVDHKGEIVDGDELLFLIARDRFQVGKLDGGVVGTQMSNLGLEIAMRVLGIDFCRTKVGDRYVMAELAARNWQLGGETSGHLVCRSVTSTGDGIVAALQVLVALLRADESLHDLKHGMQKFPQKMINVRLGSDADVLADEKVQKAVKEVEAELGDRGRVLLRPSGTEPVVRVMVEGEEAAEVERLATQLAAHVEAAFAS